ncbi:helix-turn-helix domain-containing protein [Flavobacterium sp.]|uniref:helix-turn-helix domain-containing protein n=1 Tax=Flavobacterium sp. TaxID=239 RepID=UPI0037511363
MLISCTFAEPFFINSNVSFFKSCKSLFISKRTLYKISLSVEKSLSDFLLLITDGKLLPSCGK